MSPPFHSKPRTRIRNDARALTEQSRDPGRAAQRLDAPTSSNAIRVVE